MIPMTYDEWREAEETAGKASVNDERYRTYLAGMAFIRSQIGGLPYGGHRDAPVLRSAMPSVR